MYVKNESNLLLSVATTWRLRRLHGRWRYAKPTVWHIKRIGRRRNVHVREWDVPMAVGCVVWNLSGSRMLMWPGWEPSSRQYWCSCCHRRKIAFISGPRRWAWPRMRSRETKSVLGPLFSVAYSIKGSSWELCVGFLLDYWAVSIKTSIC